MKFGLGILAVVLFVLVLWGMTEFWFRFSTDIGYSWGIPSALISTVGLIAIFFDVRLLMAVVPWHIPWLVTFCIAAIVWSFGLYLFDTYKDYGNFSFFAFGDLMIDEGEITEHGHDVHRARLLSKLSTAVIFATAWLAYHKISKRDPRVRADGS